MSKTNKKGFIFALLTLLLFTTLLALAINLRVDRGKVSSWAQDMIVTRKLLYTTDDIAEDVQFGLGTRVQRSGDTLIIYDHLPANFSLNTSLYGYDRFVKTMYLTPEMRVQFYDEAGNEISLNQMNPTIIIYPYNITYGYEDYGKRELSVNCQEECKNNLLNAVGLNFNLTDSNFTWNPVPGNESHYQWSPNFLYNGTCSWDTCINFSLVVRDSLGRSYTCPGPICNYNQFRTDKKSALSIQMTPCWLEVIFGNSEDNIFLVRLHEPGNPDKECESDVNLETALDFPSSEYYLNLPGYVRVTDINYNASRVLLLPGENISARELRRSVEPPNYTESECFVWDASNVWAGGSEDRYIYGFRMSNSCTGRFLTITKVNVSWTPNTGQQIEVVNINGTSYWAYNGAGTPDGRQPSGTLLDMVDFSMYPLTSTNITYLRFASGNNMSGESFTIDFYFGDNTTKHVAFGPV